MNALLFAHVSIRVTLLCAGLLALARAPAARTRRARWLDRGFVIVLAAAALEAAYRLFLGTQTAGGWLLDAATLTPAISDVALTAALLIGSLKRPRPARAQTLAALRRGEQLGRRARAAEIAARLSQIVGGTSRGSGDLQSAGLNLLHDLRATDLTSAPQPAATTLTPRATGKRADATLARIGRELRLAAPQGILVRLDFSRDLGDLLVDSEALHDALQRLGRNAVAAMPEGGVLRLRAEIDELKEGNALRLAAGPWMRVELTDNGAGMPAEVRDHCCEPFYTTQPDSAGLGLWAVTTFARQAGGALSIMSGEGQGTTVSLWLPAAPVAAPASSLPAHLIAVTMLPQT